MNESSDAERGTHGDGGWNDYRKYLLEELRRLSTSMRDQGERMERLFKDIHDDISDFKQNDITKIKVDIAMLQVKAGMLGAVSGAVVSSVVSIIVAKMMMIPH